MRKLFKISATKTHLEKNIKMSLCTSWRYWGGGRGGGGQIYISALSKLRHYREEKSSGSIRNRLWWTPESVWAFLREKCLPHAETNPRSITAGNLVTVNVSTLGINKILEIWHQAPRRSNTFTHLPAHCQGAMRCSAPAKDDTKRRLNF